MKPRSSSGCGAWPSTSARQEKLAGLPASMFCTVSAAPCEHRSRRVQLDLMLVDADQHVLDRGDQAAQARILAEIGDKRLALHQPVEALLQLIRGHEQQAVAGEEVGGAGIGHRLEMRRVLLERRVSASVAAAASSGVGASTHDVDDLEAAERVLEHDAALAPRQILGEQRVDVGGDREMRGGVNAADDGEQNANEQRRYAENADRNRRSC